MRGALIVAAAVATAVMRAQPALADEVERTAQADPHGDVAIGNTAGSVRVIGWDRSEVKVNADLASGVERLDFASEGGRTVIRVVLTKGRHSSSTDLVVHVPRGSALAINTISADQSVEDVKGAQRLQAVSGNIATEVWDEDFEMKTVSGEVAVRGHGGSGLARVQTISGDVRLEDIGHELELGTVSGDMQVRTKELSRARIKTTNGDLELRTTLTGDARVDAEGINADLRFHLRGVKDAEFDIETFNGEIDNCFGPQPRRTREYGPGTELRFKQGDGSARVRIKSLNGTVEICNK